MQGRSVHVKGRDGEPLSLRGCMVFKELGNFEYHPEGSDLSNLGTSSFSLCGVVD